nr:hypothetical protein [uncultured Albidiferax sp.]
MTDALWIAVAGAGINAIALWATLSTKLDWMRSDIEDLEDRVGLLERRK